MVSRSELATRLARNGSSHAQAVHAVDAVLHEITAALVAGERVSLTGFGTFEPVARPARTARNPRTGAAVQVAAATVVRFRPGTGLRGALLTGDAGTAPAGAMPPTLRADAASAPSPAGHATAPTEDVVVAPAPRHGKQSQHPKPTSAAKAAKSAKAAKAAKADSSSSSVKVAKVKKGSKAGPKAKKAAGAGGKKSKAKR